MTLAVGARLGPYEILGPLGAGGMGEVYRARDSRLGRDVAVKVLPAELASEPERLKRFEKEARAASALSHPNIVTIYDIGREGAVSYLAMELVAGSTLRELLSEGPLPVKRALSIATDVAQGLARAHAAGIVHRDLKPENVMVGSDGFVKILDFGLAKLTQPKSDSGHGTHVPTLSLSTEAGVVIGTVGYMSPEQASGDPMDFRSDQFSLGAVMYEMLTGRRAFVGASAPQTLAAIIEAEPEPITSANPRVPPPARWIVDRCLAKDPKSRYASTEDLARDLATVRERFAELSGSGEQDRAAPAVARRAGREGLLITAAALAMAAVAGLLTWLIWHRESQEPRAVARFSIDLPRPPLRPPIRDLHLAISPDGTRLAWTVGKEDRGRPIQVRRLDQSDATSLAGTEGARVLFFSPDGESLGFFADGKLKKVSLYRGTPMTVCEVEKAGSPVWGSDGQIYFTPGESAIWRVPAVGGVAQPFTTLAKSEVAHGASEMLPGSGALVFTVVTPADYEIAALFPGSRDKRVLMRNAFGARYAAGHLIFARVAGAGATLFAGSFDAATLQWKGPVVPVLEGVSLGTGSNLYGFSRNGAAVYVRAAPAFNDGTLVRVDRRGTEKSLTELPRAFHSPQLSPDGTRLAVSIGPDVAKRDVWTYEVERGSFTRLTHDEKSGDPVWSPDGGRICYDSLVENFVSNIFCQKADGSGKPERLISSSNDQIPGSISPDGGWLAFSENSPRGSKRSTWLVPLSRGGPAKLLVTTPFDARGACFSPDGQWLAYQSDESGRNEIYVHAFPRPSGRWQISTDGGTEPAWSRDGRELLFRQGDKMMAVAIGTSSAFKAGAPRVLFEGKYAIGICGPPDYCVTSDGNGFLMVKPVDSGAPIRRLEVILNWAEELKRPS